MPTVQLKQAFCMYKRVIGAYVCFSNDEDNIHIYDTRSVHAVRNHVTRDAILHSINTLR